MSEFDESKAKDIRVDHGVTAHGHDANVTDAQLRLIQNVTSSDGPLFRTAGEIFREQVARAEKRASSSVASPV